MQKVYQNNSEDMENIKRIYCYFLKSRRKTANRFLPPLPTLDIPSTPEYKHLLHRPSTPSMQDQGATPKTNDVPIDYFPSPSQVKGIQTRQV